MVSFEAGGLRILHLFPEPFSGYTSLTLWSESGVFQDHCGVESAKSSPTLNAEMRFFAKILALAMMLVFHRADAGGAGSADGNDDHCRSAKSAVKDRRKA